MPNFNNVPPQGVGEPRGASQKPQWQRQPVSQDEALAALRRAAAQRGVMLPPEIIADGEIHRCATAGRNGQGDGAYLLHLDGLPAGGFQNWQDGAGWQDWHADPGRPLSIAENDELRKRQAADKAKREAARQSRRVEAETKADTIWEKARVEADDHPYLVRKGVAAHGARRQDRSNNLLIPMHDEHGALCNLQLIDAEGQKRFLGGGIKKGCAFTIGTLVDGAAILIAEGYATAASLHQATGFTVVVAFDAGNLLAVAQMSRTRWPGSDIAICADDDFRTDGNPGVAKASEAAAAIGARLIVPEFSPDRGEKETDFNDVHVRWGDAEVKRQINVGLAAKPEQEIIPPEQTAQMSGAAMLPAIAELTSETPRERVAFVISCVVGPNVSPADRGLALTQIRAQTKWPASVINSIAKAAERERSMQSRPAWYGRLEKNESKEPLATMANAVTVLREAPVWAGAIALNEFTGMLWVKRQMPWDRAPGEPCEREWTEKDELAALDWMQTAGAVRLIGDKAVLQAVSLIANENPFHPVRDYFDRLVWDKTKRLDKWLTYYLGAADTPYHQAVGSRWVISAVARVDQPGCKADCCLILEGEQGIKKSSALRALAGAEWFADEISDLGSKDAALQLRGKLIIELAELDALSRAEVGKIKAYMSRQVDRFRPPYAKLTIDAPRQGIFGGSVNESEYLKDATGGRRFWPVLCGESIDAEALAHDRDQLWAEAVYRYRVLKQRWYLDSPELVKLAKEQQDARYEEDAWQPIIAGWLSGQHEVTAAGVLSGPLEILEKSKWTKADQMRVGRIMKRLEWKRKQFWVGGKPEWRYVRQD